MSFLILLILGAAIRFAVDRRAVGDPRIGSLSAPESAQRVLSAHVLPDADGRIGDHVEPDATRPRIIVMMCHDRAAVIADALEDWLLRTVQDPVTHEISVHVTRRRDIGYATDLELYSDRQARLYLPSRPLVLTDGTIVRLVSRDLGEDFYG